MYLPNQYHLTRDTYWPIVEGAAPPPSPEGSSPVGDPSYDINQVNFGPHATVVPIIESGDGGSLFYFDQLRPHLIVPSTSTPFLNRG